MDLPSYISGFVDGEGCFCVSIAPSGRHRFGWELRPSFSVSQNFDRAELLYRIQELWHCGFIRPDRSDRTLKYEVRRLRALVDHVVPHFRAYPLQSAKQADVERFDRICCLMAAKRHLELRGFREVVWLAAEMNPSGKRKYFASEILNSLGTGEGIVYASGKPGDYREEPLPKAEVIPFFALAQIGEALTMRFCSSRVIPRVRLLRHNNPRNDSGVRSLDEVSTS
jgi:hypothetical protein